MYIYWEEIWGVNDRKRGNLYKWTMQFIVFHVQNCSSRALQKLVNDTVAQTSKELDKIWIDCDARQPHV